MQFAWLPMTLNHDYLDTVTDAIPQHGVTDMVLSHRLGHVLESHLNYPERVAITTPLLERWKANGIERVWAWSHELSGLPDDLVPESPEHIDWSMIEPFLVDKYKRFFELMPNVDGIVLLVNETQVNTMRGLPSEIAQSNIENLVNIVYRACKSLGKNLALQTYCDRLSEIEMIGRVIDGLPEDILIANKHVPHDFHNPFPQNPLIARCAHRDQWIEFDLGLQFQFQNALPYADIRRTHRDMSYAYQHGARMFSTRLDRYDGEKGQNILETPWGRLSLATMDAFLKDPKVEIETIISQWESQENRPGQWPLLDACTQLSAELLYPNGQYGNKHSRPPQLSILGDILIGKTRCEAVSGWTGEASDQDFETALVEGDPAILTKLNEQMQRYDDLWQRINEQRSLVDDDEQWQTSLRHLKHFYELFTAYHQLVYHYFVKRGSPEVVSNQQLEECLVNYLTAFAKHRSLQ